jgi:hypothetical protein
LNPSFWLLFLLFCSASCCWCSFCGTLL